MSTLSGGIDSAAARPQTRVTMRTTLFALALGVLAACTTVSDAEFTHSFCERQGLEAGTANFQQCMANKQAKMERERAIRDSFRYSPNSSIGAP